MCIRDSAKCADYLCKVVDVAADMEAATVIIGSGGATRHLDDDTDREEAVKCMAEVIRQAGEYAASKEVYLAVEAINRYETNFLNTMQQATEFVQQVDHPHVRTMADTDVYKRQPFLGGNPVRAGRLIHAAADKRRGAEKVCRKKEYYEKHDRRKKPEM